MERRLSQKECSEKLSRIAEKLRLHEGRKVMLLVKNGRQVRPIVATLECVGEKTYGRYRKYGKDGKPNAQMCMYVNPALVHTGNLRVVYFNGV